MAEAQRQWHDLGEPVAAQLGIAIRDARRTATRAESELLTARLDRLQHQAPDRTLGQDLGLSL